MAFKFSVLRSPFVNHQRGSALFLPNTINCVTGSSLISFHPTIPPIKPEAPIIQAMVFNYPDDVNTYNIDDQYFFGENMLVCPVTEKGAKSRTLYLPD